MLQKIADKHLTISHLLQEWQENISEIVTMNFLKDILPKICITGHRLMHETHYSENMHDK